MDEPVRLFIVPPDIATDVEAELIMMGIEQGLPVGKIQVRTSEFIPPNTIYIFPQRIPDTLPAINKGSWIWDQDLPGQLSWYASRSLWPFTPTSGRWSTASDVTSGGDTSLSFRSRRSTIFAGVWKRLTDRLRNRHQ